MPRLAAFALVAAALFAGPPARAERIRRFDVVAVMLPDATVEIEEHIRWDFEGASRHGIYREIPVVYERPGAADYRLIIRGVRATDAAGHAWPIKTTRTGGYLRIRIGDPEQTVTGQREYWISYRVRRAVLFFPDHDELYWNTTGDEWPVPIEQASAVVTLPATLDDRTVAVECFTGPVGSRAHACTIGREHATVTVRSSQPLATREGLTVAIGFPKNVVAPASAFRRFLDAGGGWSFAPLGTLVVLLWAWRRVGRDPVLGAAIPVCYEPPSGLTPAEVGTVFDERADVEDVTATILDLAIRGWLRITEVPHDHLLFFSNTDYRLTRLPDPQGQTLKPHEAKLLQALFAGGNEVLVSALREKFYRDLPGIRQALYDALDAAGGLLAGDPERIRNTWLVVGVFVAATALFAFDPFGPIAAAAMVATGVVIVFFGRVMPRRTRKGREAYEEILGLREFIKRVDADRLERLGRTPATFEKILPVAVVLGVADHWASAFAGIYATPPTWWQGSQPGAPLQPSDLVRQLGPSLDTMGRALASTPAGRGSSGLGGGGSSGGGFGGGGGGSW